jgi:hypothetical protein
MYIFLLIFFISTTLISLGGNSVGNFASFNLFPSGGLAVTTSGVIGVTDNATFTFSKFNITFSGNGVVSYHPIILNKLSNTILISFGCINNFRLSNGVNGGMIILFLNFYFYFFFLSRRSNLFIINYQYWLFND